ncbi:MAG: hypothetical protein ACO1QR_17100 [Chthoniobacteraceae bacterium]
MIVERIPEVLALSIHDKELLAEELLNQVALELDSDPGLRSLLEKRLAEHRAAPLDGTRWEDLRDRLLK